MLRSRIIPSLLLQDGELVKTVKFSEGKYIGDPINAVKIFNEKEVDELCLFDIGIKGFVTKPDFGLLEKISQEATMPLCYGGGVNSAQDAIKLVKMGYEKVSISSCLTLGLLVSINGMCSMFNSRLISTIRYRLPLVFAGLTTN